MGTKDPREHGTNDFLANVYGPNGHATNGNGSNGNGSNGNGSNGNGSNGHGGTPRRLPRRTIEMTGPVPPAPPDPGAIRASHVPNPNVALGFLIVSNPDADLGRIRRLRWLAMGVRFVSRILMIGIVIVGLPMLFAAASWLSNGQLPPSDFLWGVIVAIMLVGTAWGAWLLGHRIEQVRRELASVDGIDRNKPRVM